MPQTPGSWIVTSFFLLGLAFAAGAGFQWLRLFYSSEARASKTIAVGLSAVAAFWLVAALVSRALVLRWG